MVSDRASRIGRAAIIGVVISTIVGLVLGYSVLFSGMAMAYIYIASVIEFLLAGIIAGANLQGPWQEHIQAGMFAGVAKGVLNIILSSKLYGVMVSPGIIITGVLFGAVFGIIGVGAMYLLQDSTG